MMRLTAIVCLTTLLSTMLSGCFNTDLVAPDNNPVRIIGIDEPTQFRTEYKNWYLIAGVLPIYTTQPEEIIAKEKLTEVRVQTEDTVSDGVITFLSALIFIGLFPQTVVIEGNKASDLQTMSVK